jgi:predicted  nucleic acid-binding Zn-ribbon protein
MPEHPLFEKLMARLDEIENRIVSLEDRAAEQRDDLKVASEHLDRLADNMASMERDIEYHDSVDALVVEVQLMRDTIERAEWQSWLPARAQENIRRAS